MRIGYIRTSTGDQSGNGQRGALKAAGCDRIFHDKGVSGGAVTKPQLERALRAAGQGDALVVTRLDRLARSMKFLIEDVERIGERGVDFVSLHEAIDTTTAGGRLFFHITAAFAQFERDVIRQRTKEGMEAAKRAGRAVGRPPAITDERWPGIKQLLDSGMSIAAAARTANVPRQAIYRQFQKEESGEKDAKARARISEIPVVEGGLKPKVPGSAEGLNLTEKYSNPSTRGTTKMVMRLVVENNNKHVRGKGKTRQAIEMQLLPEFQARKLSKDGWEYELTFVHEDDDDLEEKIYGLSAEMSVEADFRNGFIEVEFQEVGTDRFWSA